MICDLWSAKPWRSPAVLAAQACVPASILRWWAGGQLYGVGLPTAALCGPPRVSVASRARAAPGGASDAARVAHDAFWQWLDQLRLPSACRISISHILLWSCSTRHTQNL